MVGTGSKLNRPRETQAGSAGKQPWRGITRWVHRVDEVGSVGAAWLDAPAPRSSAKSSSNDRAPCLENPRREAAEHGSLRKTATFDFTLDQDKPVRAEFRADFLNALNAPNFGEPGNNIDGPNFFLSTSALPPRHDPIGYESEVVRTEGRQVKKVTNWSASDGESGLPCTRCSSFAHVARVPGLYCEGLHLPYCGVMSLFYIRKE